MSVELKVPEVGESITEVQVGRWLKQQGDSADEDEGVVEIETDKVSFELPAPVAGRIVKVLKKEGEPATVGEVIGYMEEGAAAPGAAPAAAENPPQEEKPPPKKTQTNGRTARKKSGEETPPKEPVPTGSERVPEALEEGRAAAEAEAGPASAEEQERIRLETVRKVMPAARRVLEEHGIHPEDVEGTGPSGRVLKEDVERYIRQAEDRERADRARSPMAQAPAGGDREEELVPMSPLRKRIAERLVKAQQVAALLTTFNEIDMSSVLEQRKELGEKFKEKYGIKLGFMSFFVKAVVDALKLFPGMNAEIRGDQIAYRNYYDIGVAVGGGKGLVVPVIRNADKLGFAEVEQTISDFAVRAKTNSLELSELEGGTFTISNGGVYGSLLSTPIVNPPQSGILGLHAIQERPVGREGRIELRPMMYVAVTYDHRLVDGREAVTFLRRIKDCVESPSRMLLEI